MSIAQHEVLSLPDYCAKRSQIRKEMIQQRKVRCLALTDNIRLAFENKETVKYQIQEVMYAAKNAAPIDIANEIATYEHLIPCGQSLKAALFLEFEKDAEQNLLHLKDFESTVFLQVQGHEKIWPLVNTDLNGQRIISPVHYLEFVFTTSMISSLLNGAKMHYGNMHNRCPINAKEIPAPTREALLNDF